MSTITPQELERDALGLLTRVQAGEHLLVIREDRVIAEFRPVTVKPDSPRPFGLCAGQFNVPDDFDAPLPEDVLLSFEGR